MSKAVYKASKRKYDRLINEIDNSLEDSFLTVSDQVSIEEDIDESILYRYSNASEMDYETDFQESMSESCSESDPVEESIRKHSSPESENNVNDGQPGLSLARELLVFHILFNISRDAMTFLLNTLRKFDVNVPKSL